MFSSDYLRVGAVILDLEAERVPIAITFGHRRVGIGESDRGDPIAALRIRLGLDDPCESHIGNPIIDEGDVAHPRLDDCVFPPGVLGTGSIVVAEEACPALLLRRLRQDCHEAAIPLRSRRYPALTRPEIGRASGRETVCESG